MRRHGVRTRLILMAVLLMVLLGTASVLQIRSALLSAVGEELDKRALSEASLIAVRATDPLLTRSILEVRQILQDTVQNTPDVRYAFVVDAKGRLISHTFSGGFPRDLLQAAPEATHETSVRIVRTEEGPIHEATAPILGGLAGHVRVGISQGNLTATLQQVERAQGITLMAVGLLAVGIAYYVITSHTQRIEALVQATQSVGDGNLSTRVDPGPPDELGTLAGAFNSMAERLTAAQEAVQLKEQARTDLLQKLITAQEEERGRISRELHDEVGQALTGLMVGLKVIAEERPPDPALLSSLRQVASDTLQEVRHLSRALRPAVLDDMGLTPAIGRYVEEFSRLHGIHGDLQVIGSEEHRLPPAVETTLYRVMQEALTNVARHSGAHRFSVVLALRPPVASLIVEDDGRGFDPESPREGIGLQSVQERVALVGGALHVESRPGGGTTLFVKVPVPNAGGAGTCGS